MIKYFWSRSKLSKVLSILFFLLIISLPAILVILYLPDSWWHVFSFSLLITNAVFWIIARKKGWVKPFAPKQLRWRVLIVSGVFCSLPIIIAWRAISGSPLPSHSFIIFLILFAVGAYLGDRLGKNLRYFNKQSFSS